MKKLIAPLCILFFVSCHVPPESYELGVKNFEEKKWDKAIEAFSLVTKEDEDWLDSASQKKNEAFFQLMAEGDWKMTFRVLAKYIDDDDLFFAATDSIEQHFFGLVTLGKSDSVLELLEENRDKLEEFIDTVFTKKLVRCCEDSLFAGVWEAHGSLKGQEIYFKRDGNEFHAYSNKSRSGWIKDGIIYKQLIYDSGLKWNVKPKVFKTSYWGNSEYYSKKGSISFKTVDTLVVGYEALGNESTFSRKGNSENSNSKNIKP